MFVPAASFLVPLPGMVPAVEKYCSKILVVYFDQRRVLHTGFASQNHFFSAKTTFGVILCYFLHYFILKSMFEKGVYQL